MSELDQQMLLQKLSVLEHEQWTSWAKKILETENISEETRAKWASYFVDFQDLPAEIQNLDRDFAKKSLDVFIDYVNTKNI